MGNRGKRTPAWSWVYGMPMQAVEHIDRIMLQTEGRTSQGRGASLGSKWWVRVSPTTGQARDVTLIHRSTGRSWPIMCNGRCL